MSRPPAAAGDAAPAAARRGVVSYEDLRAHGLQEPAPLLPEAPAPSPPRAGAALDVNEPPRAEPVLVVNEAGRWELQRAPGDDGAPPPALQRPGAEQAAAARKRKLQAEVAARVAAPGSTFALSRVVGAAATERDAEAAARARLKERRLAELAKARMVRTPTTR